MKYILCVVCIMLHFSLQIADGITAVALYLAVQQYNKNVVGVTVIRQM